MQKVKKAVFPVGGLGTRFLPATKALPKEMLPVVDKPLIQYVVEEAQKAGIEEFIFVTGRGKSAIEDHFDHSFELERTLEDRGKEVTLKDLDGLVKIPGSIAYTRQQDPMGLGHAVWCARHFIQDEPFAVLLADDFIYGGKSCLQEMVETYEEQGGNVVALMEVADKDVHRYGIAKANVKNDKLWTIQDVVEKPSLGDAPSNLAIIGRYILQPSVMKHLGKHQKGAGGEIQLTDAMRLQMGQTPFHGMRFEGRRFDCGSKEGLLLASLNVALDREDLADSIQQELVELSKQRLSA